MSHSLLVLYHFFYPDTNISARLFSDFAEYAASRNYRVTVYAARRLMRKESSLPAEEDWHGVKIRRFWRPDFPQGNPVGRLLNSLVLQFQWLLHFFLHRKEFDAVLLGTDPQFGYLICPFLRLFSRKVKIIHWVFDLYPEALMVNSPGWMRFLAGLVRWVVPLAYHQVDLMADIGLCIRKRVQQYFPVKEGRRYRTNFVTATTWALAESEKLPEVNQVMRRELFGDYRLGILYSGTVGYAHDIRPFIQLARKCRELGLSVGFCFAGYGNQYRTQLAELTAEDVNIRTAGFIEEKLLEQRLAAADIHMISLREGWEGIVVPSKFFGALALGRTVLFSGSEESSLAGWIRQYGLGMTLQSGLEEKVLEEFRSILAYPEAMVQRQQKVLQVYQKHFSRQVVEQQFLQDIEQCLEE